MKLKDFLTKYNISSSLIARKTGLTTATIISYQNGAMPSVENAFKIEDVTLGIIKAESFVEKKKGGSQKPPLTKNRM